MKSWRLSIPSSIYGRLHHHLFPGDNDEHGAVILAGLCDSDRGLRLIAKELFLAKDGEDYVPGRRGYRMLKAEFIQTQILRAREHRLAYLAIHNHGGKNSVAFSGTDMASHERGYPALLDIARGMPVGALVFAKEAVAGELWIQGYERVPLKFATIIGQRRFTLSPNPKTSVNVHKRYDRQSRLFGDIGQNLLQQIRVGIVGVGGAGSVLAELLGRLGVGEFLLVDPERAEETNLPRLIGSRNRDAGIAPWIPKAVAKFLCKPKVQLAARNIRRANPSARIELFEGDFLESKVAARFTDCDFLFLAADTMGARLLFNAIVHQYAIPGIQVGAKIPVDDEGNIGNVFCVSRMITPGNGCLWCNGLISPKRLQDEAIPFSTRQRYSYIDDPQVVAPSVVTLNAIACAHAADDFLFYITGLKDKDADGTWFRWNPRSAKSGYDLPRHDLDCTECSMISESRMGMGDSMPLPTKPVERHLL